jgi:DNA-binding NarL/FixJ family response regulator
MLTDSKNEEDLFSSLDAGATGYLLKDMKFADLVKSIDLIAKGEVIISPPLANKLVNKFAGMKASEAEAKSGLSDRELEILKLLAKGHTNKEIADSLFIAENTTKVHVKNILGKLQLRNRQQAAAYAVQQGLTTEVKDVEETPD